MREAKLKRKKAAHSQSVSASWVAHPCKHACSAMQLHKHSRAASMHSGLQRFTNNRQNMKQHKNERGQGNLTFLVMRNKQS